MTITLTLTKHPTDSLRFRYRQRCSEACFAALCQVKNKTFLLGEKAYFVPFHRVFLT